MASEETEVTGVSGRDEKDSSVVTRASDEETEDSKVWRDKKWGLRSFLTMPVVMVSMLTIILMVVSLIFVSRELVGTLTSFQSETCVVRDQMIWQFKDSQGVTRSRIQWVVQWKEAGELRIITQNLPLGQPESPIIIPQGPCWIEVGGRRRVHWNLPGRSTRSVRQIFMIALLIGLPLLCGYVYFGGAICLCLLYTHPSAQQKQTNF